MKLPPTEDSYWLAKSPKTQFPSLEGDIAVDVVMVLAGFYTQMWPRPTVRRQLFRPIVYLIRRTAEHPLRTAFRHMPGLVDERRLLA